MKGVDAYCTVDGGVGHLVGSIKHFKVQFPASLHFAWRRQAVTLHEGGWAGVRSCNASSARRNRIEVAHTQVLPADVPGAWSATWAGVHCTALNGRVDWM